MTHSLIVASNNKSYRAKDNSWYVLHVMTESKDEFAKLDPVFYQRDDGSIRHKAKLPILLSITSTEVNEVLMDVSDIFKCYNIPYSQHLRLQMYVDGMEVKPPGCHGAPNISQHKTRENSWYLLYVKNHSVNDYEKLDPEECRLDDERIRFKVKIPMLVKTDDQGKESPMSVDDICKLLNVPVFYGRVLMYVNGEEVEYPASKITSRSYTLPAGAYYVGDPFYVLSNKEITQFRKYDDELFFKFRGHQVVCIKTGGDGALRIYHLNECGDALDDNGREVEAGRPVYDDCLLVDTATIAFIPLEILGVSLGEAVEGEAGENGLILNCEPDNGEDTNTLDVQINYSFRYDRESVETVRFLHYEVLIADQEKYEDI